MFLYQIFNLIFSFETKTNIQHLSSDQKVLQYVYLTQGVQLRVYDVMGDGNCLYHCLFYWYKKYSLKAYDEQVSFSSEQELKKYLILYVSFYFYHIILLIIYIISVGMPRTILTKGFKLEVEVV